MKRLLRIEWAKISSYNLFRVILILNTTLFLLVLFVFSRIDISIPGFSWRNIYRFPGIWSSFAWVASWFNVLLAILVMVVTGNEFASKTFRHQVISGMSRNEWLAGKGILITGIALFAVVLVIVAALIYGFIFTNDLTLPVFFENTGILIVYFLQAIGYMILALLFIVVLRSNALSIILYLLYFIFIEPVIRVMCPPEVRIWFPVKIISHLTPVPEFFQLASQSENINPDTLTFEGIGLMARQLPQSTNLIMAVAYIILFGFLTWLVVQKRDL